MYDPIIELGPDALTELRAKRSNYRAIGSTPKYLYFRNFRQNCCYKYLVIRTTRLLERLGDVGQFSDREGNFGQKIFSPS